jgi:hypothetical protein
MHPGAAVRKSPLRPPKNKVVQMKMGKNLIARICPQERLAEAERPAVAARAFREAGKASDRGDARARKQRAVPKGTGRSRRDGENEREIGF